MFIGLSILLGGTKEGSVPFCHLALPRVRTQPVHLPVLGKAQVEISK